MHCTRLAFSSDYSNALDVLGSTSDRQNSGVATHLLWTSFHTLCLFRRAFGSAVKVLRLVEG